MNRITFAHMTTEDISMVSEIVIEAFNKPPVNESWTKETSTAHLQEALDPEFSFVAKENDVVIGALVGNTTTYDKGKVYDIDILVVREEKRGHGIGEELIKRAEETAKTHGIKIIDLETGPHLRAFEWYKRLGFKETGWVELEKELQ